MHVAINEYDINAQNQYSLQKFIKNTKWCFCPTSVRITIIWKIKAGSENDVEKFEILYIIARGQSDKIYREKKNRIKATHKI